MPEMDTKSPPGPPAQGVTNKELTQSTSPYDTSAESKELEALKNELSQAEQSLEGNAAKAIASQITPEIEDLFFEDREAFLKALFKMQNDYLEAEIKPKVERAKALEADISQKQSFADIDSARAQFLEAHPEVDFNALMEFYTSLDASAQERLGSLEPLAFFETLLELFNAQNVQGEAKDEQAMPTQLQGVEGNSVQSGVNDGDLPMNRF